MRLGLTDTPWTWDRLLTRRLFPLRESVSPSDRKLYEKRWTPRFPTLSLKHAA